MHNQHHRYRHHRHNHDNAMYNQQRAEGGDDPESECSILKWILAGACLLVAVLIVVAICCCRSAATPKTKRVGKSPPRRKPPACGAPNKVEPKSGSTCRLSKILAIPLLGGVAATLCNSRGAPPTAKKVQPPASHVGSGVSKARVDEHTETADLPAGIFQTALYAVGAIVGYYFLSSCFCNASNDLQHHEHAHLRYESDMQTEPHECVKDPLTGAKEIEAGMTPEFIARTKFRLYKDANVIDEVRRRRMDDKEAILREMHDPTNADLIPQEVTLRRDSHKSVTKKQKVDIVLRNLQIYQELMRRTAGNKAFQDAMNRSMTFYYQHREDDSIMHNAVPRLSKQELKDMERKSGHGHDHFSMYTERNRRVNEKVKREGSHIPRYLYRWKSDKPAGSPLFWGTHKTTFSISNEDSVVAAKNIWLRQKTNTYSGASDPVVLNMANQHLQAAAGLQGATSRGMSLSMFH